CHITYGDATNREELSFYTSPQYGALRAAHNARKVLRAGVTSMADPISISNIGVALRDGIRSGIVEGPRLVTAGRALSTAQASGYPNRLHPADGFASGVPLAGKDEIVREIRKQVNDGVDFIKVMGSCESTSGNSFDTKEYQTFSYGELETIMDEAHRLGRKVAVHARSGPAAADVARAGADWIFHCSFMTEKHLEVIHRTRRVICPTLTYLANAAD
ncbi:MAG: amidohydrolase family protein, partial [Alphaproteobacteria bacterium]|nr:amidohydrolase family protein [Alphaproteobacteria bacterium]